MKTQGRHKDVVFLSGVRTGYGAFGGTLKGFSATQLGAIAARSAIGGSGVDPEHFDHAVFGNAQQTSADAIYLARHVALQAGLPVETPAVTVNRLCGSGFESIIQGAQQILLDESNVVLAAQSHLVHRPPFQIILFSEVLGRLGHRKSTLGVGQRFPQ